MGGLVLMFSIVYAAFNDRNIDFLLHLWCLDGFDDTEKSISTFPSTPNLNQLWYFSLFLLHIYQFDIKTTASEAWYPFYASMSKRWVVAVVGDIFIFCNNEYYSHLKQTITSRDTLLSAIACSFAGLGQNENNLTLIHWQVYILS